MRLEGKGVIVTGATGIAAAGARLAAAEGASVFVISRDENECAALADSIRADGGSCGWAEADLSDEEEAVSAFGSATAGLERVDGLFAVAGGSGRSEGDGPVHDLPLHGWNATLEMNGSPAFLAVRETVRVLRGQSVGGAIVLVSSVLAESPVPSLFATHAYAAIKGANNAFGRSLAAYYASEQIRVNVIAPGLVATPMSERAASDAETVAYAQRKQPLASGFLQPEDVAEAAVFLLSDGARRITGQTIAVDGGWSVTEA